MGKLSFSGISAVIFDIEGTVAPISFVKDTLFPYALKALPAYLESNFATPDFKEKHLSQFPSEAQASPEALIAHVEDLTRRDVKVAYLKNLQGTLWRRGYEDGELVTPLFDDVVSRMRSWKSGVNGGAERKLAIFSSGSVEAQKMFFGHVGVGPAEESKVEKEELGTVDATESGAADDNVAAAKSNGHVAEESEDSNGEAVAEQTESLSKANTGDKRGIDAVAGSEGDAGPELPAKRTRRTEDLQPLFEPYWFDTVNAGNKMQSSSYEKIVGEIGVPAGEALFLSDHIDEVLAAIEAGLHAVMLIRPGNPAQDTKGREVQTATTLEEIDLTE